MWNYSDMDTAPWTVNFTMADRPDRQGDASMWPWLRMKEAAWR